MRPTERAQVASAVVIAVGIAMSLLYAAQISMPLSGLAVLVVGVGSVICQVVGIRVNRPPVSLPWWCFVGASVGFLVGVIVRPWSVQQPGLASASGDAFTLSGYLMLGLGIVLLLRRRGGLQRHALTDGVIVCFGAGLVAVELLAIPAARFGDRPWLISMLAGIYPVLDVVLLLLLLNLAFSTATRLTGFRFFTAGMVSLFVGDVGYGVIGARGELTGSPLLDLPFLVAFTLLAAAAVHPSMARTTTVRTRTVQPWSLPRLALIVPALAVPVALILRPGTGAADRTVLAATSGLLMAALLLRAVSAVRSHTEIQRGLRFQASHDALTGLPNRVLLTEEVGALLRTQRQEAGGPAEVPPAWLLFLDLDGFKLVNDHWGHDTGDLLLIEVARRLKALGGRRAIARISGDEFALAGSGPLSVADDLARRVQAALAVPFELPGIELMVTSSIGIAVVSDQLTAEALLRDADLAMYRAKAEGRNRWKVFDADMRQTMRDRVEIELALRQALGRDQLWVAFQPIVDCRTGAVAGAEALLRWSHPVRGPIPPTEFIPVAEETGLIDELGAFVLRESLRQLAVWRDEGILPPDFYLSINASSRQLRDHGLRDLVDEELHRYGFGGDRVVLEITESIMMGESESVTDILGGLRDLGIGLSVDDFGTGYSSLSYLSRFPVTCVKIDRAFVSGLGVDPGDEAIVRAVVAMASALDLTVIAEGVETEPQREMLCELDVVHAQGWLWAKAACPPEFADQHLRVAPTGIPARREGPRADAPVRAGGVQAGVGNS